LQQKKERERFGKREKNSAKGREHAHFKMHYNRKERNKASMLGRKKESFNAREKDSFNNRERERGLGQGREKMIAKKKEKDFRQRGESTHTFKTSCNREGRKREQWPRRERFNRGER